MVFSSIPAYNLDPSNWQQEQNQQSVLGSTSTSPFLPPPPQPSGPSPGSIRPGSMAERAQMANIPVPESALKCPRCESINTKFCYFNNYSLSQPRHFCKTCRRYWTRGGALRSVPVGGGYRRNRRSKPSSSKSTAGSSDRTTQATSSNSTGSPAGFMSPPLRFASPTNLQAGNFSPHDDMGLSYTNDMNFQLGSIFGGVGAPLASSGPGIEPWRLQQVQNFPFLGGLDLSPPPPTEIYNFQSSERDHLARPRSLSSSILTQRGSVKNEESLEPRIKDNQWNGSTSSSWTELSSFRISSSNRSDL